MAFYKDDFPNNRTNDWMQATEIDVTSGNAADIDIILASGGGSNFQAILDSIVAGELYAEIVMVVSNNSGSGALERACDAGDDS